MWKRVNMWAAQVEKKLASEILALWTLAQWLCSEPRLVFQGWLITDQLWRDHTCLGQRKQKHWLWMGRTWQIQIFLFFWDKYHTGGFPGGSVVKDLPVNAKDASLIPWSGRSPGGGNGNPLQYSCLENSMDRGTWWVTNTFTFTYFWPILLLQTPTFLWL